MPEKPEALSGIFRGKIPHERQGVFRDAAGFLVNATCFSRNYSRLTPNRSKLWRAGSNQAAEERIHATQAQISRAYSE